MRMKSSEKRWLQHWLDTALGVVEEMLSKDARTGQFCFGDAPSLADVCLIPPAYDKCASALQP